jgi:hypothetical protein
MKSGPVGGEELGDEEDHNSIRARETELADQDEHCSDGAVGGGLGGIFTVRPPTGQ